MAVKYTLNGIEYNDVKTRGKEYQPIPPLVSDTIYNCNTEDLQESFNGGSIPTIVNAIEIDWNDAYLQRNNKSLNNTSDLLNILDNTVPAELFDIYTERVEDAYNSSYNYIQKTSILEHTIDNLKSTITYIESDVSGVKQSMGSIIDQTASGISTRVESLESQYNGLSGRISANTSSIEQTANRITSKVESLETQYDGLSGRVSANTSSIEQTATDILARIDSSINDTKTEFKLDLSGIRGTVVDLNNNYSTISQSLTEISSEVYGTTGGTKYSKIQQNADEINAKVVSLSGSISEIKITTDDISLQVSRLSGIVDSVTGATFNNSDYELAVAIEEAYVDQNGNLIANFNYTLAKHVKTESENNIINNYDFIENEEAYRNNDKTSISNSLFYVSIYDNIGLIRNNNVFCEVDPRSASDDKKNELLARGFKLYEKYGNYNNNNQVWTTAMFSTIAPVSGSGNPGLNRRDYYPINSLTNFWTRIEKYEKTSYWDLPKDIRPESFTIEFREDVKQPNGSYSNKLISRRIIKIGLQTSATLDITDDRIKSSVGVSGIIGSTIEQSISGIKYEVFDENNKSKIKQLSDRITQEVNDLSGTIGSTIEQSISGIKHEVFDADGKLNKTMQTAQSTINWIGYATGSYSSFTQAVSGIASEVAGTSGISSLIAQTATGIHASVVSGLSRTGIDIENQLIEINSDNFIIRNNEGDPSLYVNKHGDVNIAGYLSQNVNTIKNSNDWLNTFKPINRFFDINKDTIDTLTGNSTDGYPLQRNLYGPATPDLRTAIGKHWGAIDGNISMLDIVKCNGIINVEYQNVTGSNLIVDSVIYLPMITLQNDNNSYTTKINLSGSNCIACRLSPKGRNYNGSRLFTDVTGIGEITNWGPRVTEGFHHISARGLYDENFTSEKFPPDYSLYFNIEVTNNSNSKIYSSQDLVITNNYLNTTIYLKGLQAYYFYESSTGDRTEATAINTDTEFNINSTDKYKLYAFVEIIDINDGTYRSNWALIGEYKNYDITYYRTLTTYGNLPLHYNTYNELYALLGNKFILANNTSSALYVIYNPSQVYHWEGNTKVLSYDENKYNYFNFDNTCTKTIDGHTIVDDNTCIITSAYLMIPPSRSMQFTLVKEVIDEPTQSIDDHYTEIDTYNGNNSVQTNYSLLLPTIYWKPDSLLTLYGEFSPTLFDINRFGPQVYFNEEN